MINLEESKADYLWKTYRSFSFYIGDKWEPIIINQNRTYIESILCAPVWKKKCAHGIPVFCLYYHGIGWAGGFVGV
jgi:hypothetical protein